MWFVSKSLSIFVNEPILATTCLLSVLIGVRSAINLESLSFYSWLSWDSVSEEILRIVVSSFWLIILSLIVEISTFQEWFSSVFYNCFHEFHLRSIFSEVGKISFTSHIKVLPAHLGLWENHHHFIVCSEWTPLIKPFFSRLSTSMEDKLEVTFWCSNFTAFIWNIIETPFSKVHSICTNIGVNFSSKLFLAPFSNKTLLSPVWVWFLYIDIGQLFQQVAIGVIWCTWFKVMSKCLTKLYLEFKSLVLIISPIVKTHCCLDIWVNCSIPLVKCHTLKSLLISNLFLFFQVLILFLDCFVNVIFSYLSLETLWWHGLFKVFLILWEAQSWQSSIEESASSEQIWVSNDQLGRHDSSTWVACNHWDIARGVHGW